MDDGFFVVVSPPVYSAPKVRKLPITTLVVFNDKGFRGAKSQSNKYEVDFECPYKSSTTKAPQRRTLMLEYDNQKRLSVMRAQQAHLKAKYGKKNEEKKKSENKQEKSD